MLTGRRFWTLALIIGLCALATAGCKRKKSGSTTIINGSDIFTTDNFPGAGVQANNVSDDKRALSNSGENYRGNLQVFWNGNRGQAIIAYGSQGGSTGNAGAVVHYFNGETFTPPVSLRALDLDSGNNGFLCNVQAVAWVNTENHADEAAQARNGDAMVFWTGRDHDDDLAGPDATNRALYMTYFDVSFSEDISRQYGFSDEVGTQRIDAQDETGEDVISVGLLSDGLCGEADWTDIFTDYTYHWGDDTTSIECLFVQDENNDGVAGVEDQAMYTVRFDPATVTVEDLPIPATGLTRLGLVGFGHSDSGVTSDETQVDVDFRTYNNTLIFRVCANSGGLTPINERDFNIENPVSSNDDNSLQTVSYDLATGTISSVTALNVVGILAGDGFENNAQFVWGSPSVFGSDEGLACTVIYYTMLVDEGTGAPTQVNSSGLYLAEISPTTGGVLDVAQLNFDDIDEVDSVNESDIQIQISRNGDYIWAAWRQVMDVTAGAGTDFPGASDGIYAIQYITTRPDSDGLFVIPTLTDTLSGTFAVAVPSTVGGVTVTVYKYQQSLGYICGLQSDADVMHLFFQESDSASDEIFDARFRADLVPVAVSPTVTVTSFESFENGDQTSFNLGFQAVDSGDGGGIFAEYGDDIDGTATSDFRVFAEDEGPTPGLAEIDSFVTYRQAFAVLLIATPPGEEIGTFNVVDLVDEDQRHHGAEIIHCFLAEFRVSENYSTFALRTRQFNTNTDATFTDSFVPNATPATFEFPFMFDLPNIDPSNSMSIDGFAVCGNEVGFWFEQLNHLYYQEFGTDGNGNSNDNGIGWRNIDGASDPALIDDDSAVEVTSVEAFTTETCTCCDLERAMVFWVKHFSPDTAGTDNRLQVRVRGTDNGNN